MPNQPDSSPSRRRFIQASSAAFLSAPLVASAADSESPKKPETPATPTPAKTETPANPAAAATTQNSRLNIAVVGTGGQGRHDMKNLLAINENVVALCDVDEKQVAQAKKEGGDKLKDPKIFTDYRKLLDDSKDIDAVLIATPDHWHSHLIKAFIKAGKHVYCEKPLTHSIGEAREIRELVRANPKLVTQMGNQGSAEPSMRRSVELIRAGVLGQVKEIHAWLDAGGFPHGKERPTGDDPISPGFNWDFWCGPSPYRPYKSGNYHTFLWRGWYDFGNGQMADFACHIFNTATRSLNLTYPTKVEVDNLDAGKECYGLSHQVKMHFPARPGNDPAQTFEPLTIHWYDGGPKPSQEIAKDLIDVYKKIPDTGTLIIGEKGTIFANPWNAGALIKLKDDPKFKDITLHEPTKEIPLVYPRKINHFQEWVNACKGNGKAWSDFDFGGHLTEIGLTGVLAIRTAHELDWDGEAMKAKNAPEADRLIKTEYRKSWLI